MKIITKIPMKIITRIANPVFSGVFLFATTLCLVTCVRAGTEEGKFWRVDEVRPGMKGIGRTVIKGTKIQTFQAEVLGIMKNTSPGRDMILCRLSGCNLEKTGVIAGMSGSPVYIDGKLLGAVAYAWQFGKEPIAGVTPFCQMRQYAQAYEKNNLVDQKKPRRIGLLRPFRIGDKQIDTVTVSNSFDDPQPTAGQGLWLTPLRTPLAATGFSQNSLSILREKLQGAGMVPVQGGGVSARVAKAEENTPLEPGGALTVALILGDFDLSGIGTVTHIEGKRVYGWGHPFMSLGGCELPLMTGYVHTIYPRQSLSFKMGSPLRTVGTINADVSTCIAGFLDRQPDLLPVRMTVQKEAGEKAKTFNVQVVRQPALLATLVYTSLTNSVDMEGELPDELTAQVKARIELEGREPIVIDDMLSGARYSGKRAARAIYGQVADVVQSLTYTELNPVRIKRIECNTYIQEKRLTAEIEAVELDSDVYRPGDMVKATVHLKTYKGPRCKVVVSLKLPANMAEGTYRAQIMDGIANAREDIRSNPNLTTPRNQQHLLKAVRLQTQAKRTNLVMRIPLEDSGVTLDGKALPDLPASMVHILANGRRTGVRTLSSALAARHETDWVIEGSDSVRFRVSRTRHHSFGD